MAGLSDKKTTYIQSKTSLTVKNNHDNTDQTLILITEDKLRLILQEYEKYIEYKKSIQQNSFIGLSILITIFTTEFKGLFFQKEIWLGVFLAILSMFIYLIVRDSIKIRRNKKDLNSTIEEIKNINNKTILKEISTQNKQKII